jgi:hypothetical protein
MRAAYIQGMVLCGVLVAGCFVSEAGQLADGPDAPWIPGLLIANSFAGVVDLNSNPSGAEVTTSLGSGCRTPCSLEVTAEGPFTVTFTHEGYVSATVQVKIEHARMGVSNRKFAPNPVFAELAPVPKPEQQLAPTKKPIAATRQPPASSKKSDPAVPPAEAALRKPVATAPPAAQPASTQAEPAQSIWPEPVAAAGFIVKGHTTAPADPARSSDNLVARRWPQTFDQPASNR